MSTQHTPGPWHAQNGGDVFTALGATTGDGWKAADNDGWHIADCRPGTLTLDDIGDKCELSSGEALANARLIAAAPELYEALKHEAEWHEREARTHKTLAQRNPGMVYDGLKEAWHRERAASLRAVLAKAEDKS